MGVNEIERSDADAPEPERHHSPLRLSIRKHAGFVAKRSD